MTAYKILQGMHDYETLDSKFKRLQCLQGSDAGFFVLAVHSFMEGILRPLDLVDDPVNDTFGYHLNGFKNKLIMDADGAFIPGLDMITPVIQQHQLTNDVRHQFAPATVEEARVATQHLRRFCQLAGIPKEKGLDGVLECLKAWDERMSFSETSAELKRIKEKLALESVNASKMAGKVAEYDAAISTVKHLKEEIRLKDKALEEVTSSKERKEAKVDELRAERARLADELKKAKTDSAKMMDARFYLDALSRMTILSRTRADYERTVIRLTPEQKNVLQAIRLDSDFLVKGSAGTGKTLVLLKAIEKAKGHGIQSDLELSELSGSVVLLTYTATLVKYDKYLSSIMAAGSGADSIMTADAFLRERLAAIEPGATIDYDCIKSLAEKYPLSFLKPGELMVEAESFIWAYDLTYKDYVDDMIERKGMKKPLQQPERILVWASCEAMAAEMEAIGHYSKSFSRIKILRALAANPDDPRIEKIDYIFVDEAQDLCAADLKTLKSCTRKALILAGDADQSIYQPGFSFRKAGIEISGRTRILHMNFRNTIPIHSLAERYRALDDGMDADNSPDAFRDGPEPEHFAGMDRNEILDLIVERIDLLSRHLGYDPENICILAPSGDDVKLVLGRLAESGHSAIDIRDRNFDFANEGKVRVSTFHSAKGLDFPVILMFLYRPPYTGAGFDDTTQGRMMRNLIYVAATRAMDQLCVFTLAEPSAAAIRDLVECFGESDGAKLAISGAAR